MNPDSQFDPTLLNPAAAPEVPPREWTGCLDGRRSFSVSWTLGFDPVVWVFDSEDALSQGRVVTDFAVLSRVLGIALSTMVSRPAAVSPPEDALDEAFRRGLYFGSTYAADSKEFQFLHTQGYAAAESLT